MVGAVSLSAATMATRKPPDGRVKDAVTTVAASLADATAGLAASIAIATPTPEHAEAARRRQGQVDGRVMG